jgi:hypothetical protein
MAFMTMSTPAPRRRRSVRAVLVVVVALAALAASGGTAMAEFGIAPDPTDPSLPDFHADLFDSAGNVATQAGGHPFEARVSFGLRTLDNGAGVQAPDENVKDMIVDLPPGMLGNPQATPTCDEKDFLAIDPVTQVQKCPVDSQVGTTRLLTYNTGANVWSVAPIYNMKPHGNEVAAFEFNIISVPVRMSASVRSDGDYGLRVTVSDINQTSTVTAGDISFWGVPADSSHDPSRGLSQTLIDLGGGITFPIRSVGGNIRSTTPPAPFMTAPVDCSHGPFLTGLKVDSWQHPGDFKTAQAPSASGVTGCDKLSFHPTVRLQPDTQRAAGPSGMSVDINVPQNLNPVGVTTPQLRKVIVALPNGMRVSPSSADGLQACADDQVAVHSARDSACPPASKIGDVTIDTPLLAQPLTGAVYLGTQQPNQLLRLFIVARGPAGLVIKLPGIVDTDTNTGQLTATFDDNPQLPFSHLRLHFNGGPRAPISNPSTCGTYTTTSEMTSWGTDVPMARSSDSFTITQNESGGACASLGFSPSFSAGTTNPSAGKDTTFTLNFGRDDDDQDLRDVSVDFPQGLLAHIGAVPLCPDAAAAAGTCDAASQIGTVMTAAGPGSNPLYLPGKVYITTSYKGAPFGLSIVVPARAGPFDLGTVIVRAAIFVDNKTSALRVVSDPLPSILMGIPLQIRSVAVNIDRQGFMINPTNCTTTSVGGQVSSTAGAVANVSTRFQAGNCAALSFKPRMTLRVGARRHTKGGVTTPLSVNLAMTPGQANNRVVTVKLPRTLNAQLDVVSVRNACSPDQYAVDRCPQQVGTATAVTPLLRDPLLGRVFLVRNPGRRLPDMMVRLRGQGDESLVDIDLTGKITIPKDLTLKTTFDTVPDVPITSFRLNLVSGRNAPVGAVENLCTARARKASVATLAFTGQSGKKVRSKRKMTVVGCAKTIKPKRARRSTARHSKKHKVTRASSRRNNAKRS